MKGKNVKRKPTIEAQNQDSPLPSLSKFNDVHDPDSVDFAWLD